MVRSDVKLFSSHQSGEVGMASFCRVDSLSCRLPSMLSALEEHDFLFQLHLNDIPPDDSNEVCTCLVGEVFLRWVGHQSDELFSGAGGSAGRRAAVVNSQDAFHQLYLHPLQVRAETRQCLSPSVFSKMKRREPSYRFMVNNY